jgi:hypothetical protein
MSLTGGQDVIFWLILLKHEPHAFNVVPGVSPITRSIDVTKVETLGLTFSDFGNGTSDFTGDESPTSTRGFVVEEDTIASVHAVGFTVVDTDPESVLGEVKDFALSCSHVWYCEILLTSLATP